MSENQPPPQTPGPTTQYVYAAPPRRSNPLLLILGLSALFFALFLFVSTVFFMRHSSDDSSGGASITLKHKDAVGVVELNGVIMESKKFIKQLDKMADNDRIKGVVVRLNSPGGSVAPSQEIYEAVKSFKKPLVVSMASVAASGAYYVACAAKKVYANPGTITGSIGVIMEFLNLEKLYDWAKVKRFSIKTGKFKDAGAEFREMTPEEKALLQGMVDNVLGQFKTAVSEGRKLSMEQVTAVADGRIFSGAQAKEAKLVDELGTLQDAIDDVAKQAKISGKPKVVYPSSEKRKWWKSLIDDARDDDDDEDGQTPVGPASAGINGVIQAVSRGLGAPTPARTLDFSPGLYWLWGPSG